jgi:undecaprenyl-diphosphatase
VAPLARLGTELGAAVLVVPLLAVLVAVVARRQRSWRAPLRVGAVLVALAVSVLALKALIARPAAHGGTTHGGAWPSGHTATATVVWGCVVRLLRPDRLLARLLDVVLPAVVAMCLVVAGYHQVSDVVAGFALGTVLLQVFFPAPAETGDARAAPADHAPAGAPR